MTPGDTSCSRRASGAAPSENGASPALWRPGEKQQAPHGWRVNQLIKPAWILQNPYQKFYGNWEYRGHKSWLADSRRRRRGGGQWSVLMGEISHSPHGLCAGTWEKP